MNTVSNSSADILLVVVWTVATLGSIYTLARRQLPVWLQHRFVYTGLFLLMGFIFIVRIGYIVEHLTQQQLTLFLLAALSYASGAVIYATKRPSLFKFFGFHELWHLLVVIGYGFHYFFILSFYQ
jgi:hemolysin III